MIESSEVLNMATIKRRKQNDLRETRQSPDYCHIKKRCGSCLYVNDPYETSLAQKHENELKILSEFAPLEGCEVLSPNPSPKIFQYRSSAKLAVGPGNAGQRFAIGLYQQASHTIVDVSGCPLHTESITQFIQTIKPILEASSLIPYNEIAQTGDLRYLTVRSTHTTGEMMLVFVVTSDGVKDELKRIVKELKALRIPIHSAYLNINQTTGNQIYGQSSIKLTGTENLRESLAGFNFSIGPTSFFQVNPWQAQLLLRRVEQHAGYSRGGIAWDLYCGLGPITMVLARAGYRVFGIEENPQAIQNGQMNLEKNNLANNAELMTGRVEDLLWKAPRWAQYPEFIVVNPSRRGLADAVRSDLIKLAERKNHRFRLIYVSCAVKTLARDLKELLSANFKLRQLESFDMFCHTDKLEWLAVLTSK